MPKFNKALALCPRYGHTTPDRGWSRSGGAARIVRGREPTERKDRKARKVRKARGHFTPPTERPRRPALPGFIQVSPRARSTERPERVRRGR